MDNKKRLLLQRYQQDIINDLDVQYILDDLFTQHAISSDDIDCIYRLSSRVDQTRYLLETLVRNGTDASYEAFVDSLAKDHNWLWMKLAIENNGPMPNDSFEDSLSKGDVPRLPAHHVKRVAVESNVAEKLKQLTRHKILALHGMPGSGKTCVVISALRDNPDLIPNNFNNVIFWLNFGNCKTDDDIIAQQNKLLRKASPIYQLNSYMNSSISMSSIGSNGDSHSSSAYDATYTIDDLRDKLKTRFAEPPLKECLLVLDEVNDKKCLEAFDIGCKILVTTRDTDVIKNYHPQIIEIEGNLEENESLEIFASFLEVPVSKLPWQAKKLHSICKGGPFINCLIGAQLAANKERLIYDPKHWNYYLKKLEKKEYFFIPRNPSNNPMKTIEVCITSLNETTLRLFKKLKILPDNVKVSAKVLSKLWSKEVVDVESIMKELRSKSLILEYYDREKRNYMYEIHDLIMSYLRTTGDEDGKRRLHSDFLNNYSYGNPDTPLEIDNDGYIAYYIGYHIQQTGNFNNKWSLFNKLFLNLKFLGNKVRLTGPGDVMLDLQKYENHIIHDDLDRDLICRIKAFLLTHGTDLFQYPCTDIIQSILQHESKGILYTKALHIAQENCNKNELYFEFLHEQDVDEIKHTSIDVKEKISAVCFLGDYVLVGTLTGVVKFFHIPTNKLRKELRGSEYPIKWVGVAYATNPPIVAALYYNGTIKLWYVDDVDYYDSDDIIDEEPEEASNNNYADSETISPRDGPYLNCRWTNDQEYLIMHTSKSIIVYNASPHERKKIVNKIDSFREREILYSIPCNRDKYAIVATKGAAQLIEVFDFKTKEKVIVFEENDNIVSDMVSVPGSNKIITLKPNEIIQHEFKVNSSVISNTCRSTRILSSDEIKENTSFLTMAVNKTGTLLFVSTDDSRVVCIDLKTHSRCFDLENRRGNVTAMAVSEMLMWDEFEPGSDVLLTGTGNIEDLAKVWYLDATYISQKAQKNGKVRLTTKFDVSFLHPVSPQTPNSTPNSGTDSVSSTPRRHHSFATHKEVSKVLLKNSLSLDRHSLKPLNLKGICNNNDVPQPLLAVVDDKNNIQVMRGRKVLTEITEATEEYIKTVKISPCNQYIIYGLASGSVKKYTLRTKESVTIMDLYSPVEYLNFVNPNLLMVAGKNRCLMAYRLSFTGNWILEMLQKGNSNLGSQEILNDIQGVKKKSSQSEFSRLSSSSSDTSISSKDRMFPNSEHKNLCNGSGLVECFWIEELGIVTVEYNATIKLWGKDLKLLAILNGRQSSVNIKSAAFQHNILVICDSRHNGFQTFELKLGKLVELVSIQDFKLNNAIISCDLSADGNILALGLDSGNVVIWNVRGKRQLSLLKHHKNKVHWCSFSPVPERSNRNSLASSPHPALTPQDEDIDEGPPLVLVTMATEIVWWNITYVMRTRAYRIGKRPGLNALTPIASPLEPRCDTPVANSSNTSPPKCNFFFGDSQYLPQYCWKTMWKGKTYKSGSKRKEILACIKLSGMNAKRLSHDDKFSCFVTVDNPGHIHIMNVMKCNNT